MEDIQWGTPASPHAPTEKEATTRRLPAQERGRCTITRDQSFTSSGRWTRDAATQTAISIARWCCSTCVTTWRRAFATGAQPSVYPRHLPRPQDRSTGCTSRWSGTRTARSAHVTRAYTSRIRSLLGSRPFTPDKTRTARAVASNAPRSATTTRIGTPRRGATSQSSPTTPVTATTTHRARRMCATTACAATRRTSRRRASANS
mmetsp:Transcript_10348/g.31804  ORF Transcript_10348/g.31804 Transcript_10348/m.31804 type:complete len:204 (+) Transcript_10348:70-681(+)